MANSTWNNKFSKREKQSNSNRKYKQFTKRKKGRWKEEIKKSFVEIFI